MRARLALVIVALTGAACDDSKPIHFFAAASTVEVAEAVAGHFQTATGVHVVVNVAATSVLARQIMAGAPADVFLSANVQWMDDVIARGSIDPASRVDLMTNDLVLIVASADTAPPRTVQDLQTVNGRLAIGDPAHVPAGVYAKDALVTMGVWPFVADRVLPTPDVRAAVTLVSRGEAIAGIVYRTDALVTDAVRVAATLPADSHAPIRYQLGLVPNASPDAEALWRYLQLPEVAAVIESHGFHTATEVRP